MNATEKLREALLDLNESKKREQQQLRISEALLAGLRTIVLARDPDGIFLDLFDIMRKPLDFEAAFILRENSDGTLTTAASSDPAFNDTVWRPQAMFERAFAGRPVAVYDTDLVDEWRSQPEPVKQKARSALHFAIHVSGARALFVCTHPDRGHFSQQHVTLARRFSVLAMQALQKIESDFKFADLKQAKERIDHLNLVLSAIRNVNQLIVTEKDRDRLIQSACDLLIERHGYHNAWIAVFDEGGKTAAVAEAGMDVYFEPMADMLKRGEHTYCGGKALEESDVVLVKDPASTCADCPLSDKYEGRAGMTVALKHAGKVYGLFSASVPADFADMEEEQSLVKEVANDIAFALHGIEQEEKRKEAEEAQRENEEKYRAVFNNTGTATVIIEANSIISLANKKFESLSGCTREKIEGKISWTDFVVKDDLIRMKKQHSLRRVSPDKSLKQYDFRFVDKKENIKEILLTVDIIPGTSLSVASLLDITDRKRGEKALKKSEEQYRLLADNSIDAIWQMNMDLVFTYISPAVFTMLGYTVEEWEGKSLLDLCPPEEIELMSRMVAKGIESRESACFESYFYHKNGKAVPIEIISFILFDESGTPVLLQGTSRDITDRKRAEEELRREKDNLTNIFEAIKDGIYIVNQQYDIQYVNPVLEKEFGPWKNSKCFKYFHDRSDVCPWCKNLEVWAGKTVQWEWHSIKNGKTYDLVDTPIIMPDGSIGKLEIFRDITDRRRAEKALQKEYDRSQMYLDIAGVMFVALDNTGEVILANQKAFEILQVEMQDIIGKNWFQNFIPSDQRDEVLQVYKQLMRGEVEPVEYYENVVLSKNGGERLIAWHNALLKNDEGAIVGTLASGEDITDRKRAEKELRKSEKEHRLLVETTSEGVWVLNTEKKTSDVNQALCDMLDYSREEMMGKSPLEFTDEENRKIFAEQTSKIEATEHRNYAITLKTKNGKDVHTHFSASTLFDESGAPTNSFAFITDITDVKSLEAQLRHQQKLESIGTLASGVAHEINNPVTSILNFAELIRMRTKDDELLADYTGRIISETYRVSDIVKNLLSFARQEKTSHSPALMADIINDTLSLIAAVFRKDQINVTVAVPDDLPKVKCRSQQIQQVLMNLFTNARDALNERYPEFDNNKVFKITCAPFEKEGVKWIRTTVENHGKAIPPEVMDRIFDPFFTTKPKDVGTGLGLSISYGIVQEHKGILSVESDESSTKFHLDLRVNNGWNLENNGDNK